MIVFRAELAERLPQAARLSCGALAAVRIRRQGQHGVGNARLAPQGCNKAACGRQGGWQGQRAGGSGIVVTPFGDGFGVCRPLVCWRPTLCATPGQRGLPRYQADGEAERVTRSAFAHWRAFERRPAGPDACAVGRPGARPGYRVAGKHGDPARSLQAAGRRCGGPDCRRGGRDRVRPGGIGQVVLPVCIGRSSASD